MYLLWLLVHCKDRNKYSYALSFVAKVPRQVQSKSQLQMFYLENLGEFDCVYTHFGSLDIAKIERNIHMHCHCDQGAKTSTKQLQLQEFCHQNLSDCNLLCTYYGSLFIAKIEINIHMHCHLWPRCQDKYKASHSCRCFILKTSASLTVSILTLVP